MGSGERKNKHSNKDVFRKQTYSSKITKIEDGEPMSCRLIESGIRIPDNKQFNLHLFKVPEFVEYWSLPRYKFVCLIVELRNTFDDYRKDITEQYLEYRFLRGVYLMSLTGYLNVKGEPFFSNQRQIMNSLIRSDDAKKGIPELLKDIMVQELEKEWDMFREDMLRIIKINHPVRKGGVCN